MWNFREALRGKPLEVEVSEPTQERRQVFIVRAVDPVWAIMYTPMQAQKPIYDRREQLMYIMNNLGWHMPLRRVVLVSDSKDRHDATVDAIIDRLGVWELDARTNDWIFSTDIPIRSWLDILFGDTLGTMDAIVVVVGQRNYDNWCEELNIPHSIDDSCILHITSPTEILSVA